LILLSAYRGLGADYASDVRSVLVCGSLYCLARFCWAQSLSPIIVLSGAIGAAAALSTTLLVDAFVGRALFVPSVTDYAWSGSSGSMFRPAGLLGAPPLSGTVIVLLLCAFPVAWALHSTRGHIVIACVAALSTLAVLSTLTRSSILGLLILGIVVAVIRYGWPAALSAAALMPAVYLALSGWVATEGRLSSELTRSTTLEWRALFRNYALQKLEAADVITLLLGAGAASARVGGGGSSTRGIALHNSFLTILVAYGLAGLLAFATFLFATALAGVRLMRGHVDTRAVGVSLFCLAACLSVGAAARDISNWTAVMSVALLLVGFFSGPSRFLRHNVGGTVR
jgi:hypothetical protein